MALISCPECGRDVSERASFCPGCGHPAEGRTARPRFRPRGAPARAAAIVAVMLAVGWIGARYAPGIGGREPGVRESGNVPELPAETARMGQAMPADSADERAEAPRPAPPAPGPKPDLEPATRYESWEVEALPELANAVEIDSLLEAAYPEPLRDARVEGTVRVRLLVRADGSVDPATVSIEDASAEAFGDAALSVAERMRFRPAIVGGLAVSVWVTVPILFEVAEEAALPYDENPPVRTSIT